MAADAASFAVQLPCLRSAFAEEDLRGALRDARRRAAVHVGKLALAAKQERHSNGGASMKPMAWRGIRPPWRIPLSPCCVPAHAFPPWPRWCGEVAPGGCNGGCCGAGFW